MSCGSCEAPPAAEPPAAEHWLFVGAPNSGKTSLVNALAESRLEVGNWAGTTLAAADVSARHDGRRLRLTDLPGTYQLDGERGATVRGALEGNPGALIVNVVDASRLHRDLALTLELAELGRPMIVALNLSDAVRGRPPVAGHLESELGVPVVPTRGDRGRGIEVLAAAAARAAVPALLPAYPAPLEAAAARLAAVIGGRWRALTALTAEPAALPAMATAGAAPLIERERAGLERAGLDPFLIVATARDHGARDLADRVGAGTAAGPTWGEALDRLLLHRLLGPLAALLGLALTFHVTFALADPWVAYLAVVQGVAAGWLATLPLPPLLASFLVDGLLAGVGTVVSFIPLLFVLYAVLGWLENAGVLTRVAHLADRWLRRLGLPGRAVLPLTLGMGCNVPAVQAARTLPRRDRIRAVLAVPSVPCSARLPVFVLFASAFFGSHAALVVLGLYLTGLAVAVGAALLLGAALPGANTPAAVELPAYRLPPLALVARLAWARTAAFLRGAGGPILVAVAAVWALLHLTVPGGRSLFEAVARALSPAFAPIGLGDWRLVGALISGIASKEVVLGSLAVSFLGQATTAPLGLSAGLEHLGSGLLAALRNTGSGLLGLPAGAAASSPPLAAALRAGLPTGSALAFLVFTLLYLPCVATLTAIRQELGARWMWASAVLQLTAAYLAAWTVVQLWP